MQKGTIDAFGKTYPIEIYSEAPEKRVSLTHPPTGTSITAFNGEVGWLSMPGGFHPMTAAEGEAARIDAELRFAARVRELYKDFKVLPGEPVGGRATYLVVAKAPGKPTLNLYFDQENGLLLRLIRFAETPLGRNPTQFDYSDFRQTDGVKIPYRWTLARPNGAFTIQWRASSKTCPSTKNCSLCRNHRRRTSRKFGSSGVQGLCEDCEERPSAAKAALNVGELRHG